MSKNLYKEAGNYEIYIKGTPYGISKYTPYSFFSLISNEGYVAWMPDNEQQHVNPIGVKVTDVTEKDAAKIIQQILLFKTKKDIPLESIVEQYKPLIKQILTDFESYV